MDDADDSAEDHPLRRLGKRPPPLDRCGTCERPFEAGGGRTDDHIIPREWVTKASRTNLLTWKLCLLCNKDLGAREERLRSIFAKAESHHARLHEEVAEAAARSPARTRALAPGWAKTPAGLSASVKWMSPELIDLKLVFRKLTRGLHWWEHHELPPKWNVEARVLDPETFAELTPAVGGSTIRIGHEVWWRRSPLETGDGQVWLFMLYGAVGVGVFCGAADRLAPPQVPIAHLAR